MLEVATTRHSDRLALVTGFPLNHDGFMALKRARICDGTSYKLNLFDVNMEEKLTTYLSVLPGNKGKLPVYVCVHGKRHDQKQPQHIPNENQGMILRGTGRPATRSTSPPTWWTPRRTASPSPVLLRARVQRREPPLQQEHRCRRLL